MKHRMSSHRMVMKTCEPAADDPRDNPSRMFLWRSIKSRLGRCLERVAQFWRVGVLRRPLPIDRWIADRGDQTVRIDYPLSSASLVVDVGGFQGNWSQQILDRYGCSICIFEPVSAYTQTITKRFEGCAKVTVYPFGLADAAARTQIAVLGAASSVFAVGQRQYETIELRDAAEVLEPLRSRGIDLIKINIEGGEYDLLARMIETGIARSCRDIQVQFHPQIPGAVELRRQLQEALSVSHRLTYEYPFVWENWRLKE